MLKQREERGKGLGGGMNLRGELRMVRESSTSLIMEGGDETGHSIALFWEDGGDKAASQLKQRKRECGRGW